MEGLDMKRDGAVANDSSLEIVTNAGGHSRHFSYRGKMKLAR
jgi:hypothetical protein